MPNTKHKARQPTVIQIHEEWAVKNGYAQARKRKGEENVQAPKLLQKTEGTSSSRKAKKQKTLNDSLRAQGHKPTSPQALKRQAVREPTSVERAPNHCL